MGALQQLQNSIQTLTILWPVYPNPYKLSILGDIILPFSFSKYFSSCLRLSNLVDLSFEYLISFSNKRKTTILFPSTLTFFQSAATLSGGLVYVPGKERGLPPRTAAGDQT